MKLSEIQQIFARDVVQLMKYMDERGYKYTFGETYRTPEQAQIYAQQGRGIKDSLHTKRLAIDINLFSENGEYLDDAKDHEEFGLYWESLSIMNRWGGKFKIRDGNHYERNEKQSKI